MSAWRLRIAFFAAFALIWTVGAILSRRLFGRDARSGLVAGLAASYGNTTLVGIALARAAFRASGSLPMVLIVAVQMPIMTTAIAILMERTERQHGVASSESGMKATGRSLSLNLVKNPIVIGLALGALWRLSGFAFAGLPAEVIGRLAGECRSLSRMMFFQALRGVNRHRQ